MKYKYLRHNATHFAWLEVAEENSHPVLHLILRYELDQARYDSSWFLFSNIYLSKQNKISLNRENQQTNNFEMFDLDQIK